MSDDGFARSAAIFDRARTLEGEERERYLDEACGSDAELRRHVAALLRADSLPHSPLDSPVMPGWSEQEADSGTSLPARIGNYRILRVLGRGGMGVVYLAEQENPQRAVALKVIRSDLPPGQLLRRFEREALVLGRLQHAGIAQIFEAGTADQGQGAQPFLAMEYIEGTPLVEYAHREKLGTRERLELLIHVCDAVQHAHDQGVIHRDLKPANVLVTGQGQPKILDFGIARLTGTDTRLATLRTRTGQIIGTLSYMSPEQVSGESDAIDPRTDVYALGVLCFELLSGRLPHDLSDRSVPEAVRMIGEDEPTSLGALERTYRGDLDTIVAKALERDVRRRYQSAAELASDIRRHLDDQPIVARPPSALYQLRKFARRNKALVGGAAAVLLISIIGTIVSVSYAIRESAARAEAQERADELKEVTRFQAAMLSELDAEIMGREILADLRDRARAKLGERGLDEVASAEALTGFDEAVTGVNVTDLALKVVDERILRRAVEAIDVDFADEPVIGAALRHTAAETYEEIGLYEPALRLEQQALTTRRAALGDDHPDTLASIRGMGRLLRRTGQLDAARPLIDEAVERHRRVLGDDDPMTLDALTQKGLLLKDTGPVDESERILREVLERSESAFGADEPRTAAAAGALGVLLASVHRYDEAETLYREEFEGFRKTLGEDHRDTLSSMLSIASVLTHMGRFEEAIGFHEQALEGLQSRLGENHPRTVGVLNNLGILSLHLGRTEQAHEHQREVVARYAEVMGRTHPNTLDALTNLGWMLSQSGQFEEAVATYREAYEGYHRSLGADAPETLDGMNHLASMLYRMGDYAEAARLCAEAVDRSRRTLPRNDWRLGRNLHGLGRSLTELDRFSEAEPALEEAFEIFDTGADDQRWRTGGVTNALVALYTAWHEAEPDEGYDLKAADWRSRLPDVKAGG